MIGTRYTKRSNEQTERSNQTDETNPLFYGQSNDKHQYSRNGKNSKTGSKHCGAPYGNNYAKSHKGKAAQQYKNKNAVSTHEYENFFFSDLTNEQKEFILQNESFENKQFQQIVLIKTLTMREIEIRKDLGILRKSKNNLIVDSIVKKDGESQSTMTIIRNTFDRITKLQDVLTRIHTQKQKAIDSLHRMEIDVKRLFIDQEKLELYKQRLTGRVDLNDLINDDDLDGV